MTVTFHYHGSYSPHLLIGYAALSFGIVSLFPVESLGRTIFSAVASQQQKQLARKSDVLDLDARASIGFLLYC